MIAVPLQPGAAGAADAMHVVVGMVGHIEIEDVADVRNIEAARRYVGGDEQRHFVLAELFQRRGAGLLVHVAMKRDGGEAVTDQ